jgi:hypothetical protein
MKIIRDCDYLGDVFPAGTVVRLAMPEEWSPECDALILAGHIPVVFEGDAKGLVRWVSVRDDLGGRK